MRILHLISSSGLFGAERVAIELSAGLKKHYDCAPVLGVVKNSLNPHEEVVNEAKRLGLDSVVFPCSGRLDLKTVRLIRAFMENNHIDLVHCHGYKSNFLGLLASRKKIPAVATNHNWIRTNWKLRGYCLIDSLMIRYFDKIVAVSDEIKSDMLRYRIPGRKIEVIDNGIDIERFENMTSNGSIKKELGLDGPIKVVGTIGALKPVKGQTYLLKAARGVVENFKDVKFLIVGDGPLKTQLENEAKKMGLEKNIVFAGYRSEIPELLSAMDIFVLPSLKEGLPMVVLEAMAAKKAVIATKVGAIPKIIKNTETGMLIEPMDVDGLRDGIIKLLNNGDEAHSLGQRGYLKVKKYFSSKSMAGRYFDIYRELTKHALEQARDLTCKRA